MTHEIGIQELNRQRKITNQEKMEADGWFYIGEFDLRGVLGTSQILFKRIVEIGSWLEKLDIKYEFYVDNHYSGFIKIAKKHQALFKITWM